jgi:hypothetical protein
MGNTNQPHGNHHTKESLLKISNSTPSLNTLQHGGHSQHHNHHHHHNQNNKNLNAEFYALLCQHHKQLKASNSVPINVQSNLLSTNYANISGSVNSRLPYSTTFDQYLQNEANKFDTKYKNHRKLRASSYLLHGKAIYIHFY